MFVLAESLQFSCYVYILNIFPGYCLPHCLFCLTIVCLCDFLSVYLRQSVYQSCSPSVFLSFIICLSVLSVKFIRPAVCQFFTGCRFFFVCLSAVLIFVCLSIFAGLTLFFWLSIFFCFSLSIFVCLYLLLSVHIWLSDCLSICLSVYLSICLTVCVRECTNERWTRAICWMIFERKTGKNRPNQWY